MIVFQVFIACIKEAVCSFHRLLVRRLQVKTLTRLYLCFLGLYSHSLLLKLLLLRRLFVDTNRQDRVPNLKNVHRINTESINLSVHIIAKHLERHLYVLYMVYFTTEGKCKDFSRIFMKMCLS